MSNTTLIDQVLNSIEPHEQIETDLNMSIAVRINDLMESCKKSREDLAEYLNVTESLIDQMLAGVIDFDIRLIAKLTAYFGKPVIVVKMSKLEKQKKENTIGCFKIKFLGSEHDFYLIVTNDVFGKARIFIDELRVYFESLSLNFDIIVTDYYYFNGDIIENSKDENRYSMYFGENNQFYLTYVASDDKSAKSIVDTLPFKINHTVNFKNY